jgi:hypothetical protein
MSINAIISGVTRLPNLTARLTLEPFNDDSAGQSALILEGGVPDNIESVIGTHIWGNSAEILIGEKTWAKRRGYTHIELVK